MTSLTIRNLSVTYVTAGGGVPAIIEVSIDLLPGESMGIVGESGSGKSALARAIMGLLHHRGALVGGSVALDGLDVLHLPPLEARKRRRGKVGLIFQDASTALNPVKRVGPQIAEAVKVQRGLGRKAAAAAAHELLNQVEIPEAARRYHQYPFEFSGGMRQRAMIAMALAGNPDILVADEPTTALDVTVQDEILDLLTRLRTEHQMSLLFISHDLAVVATVAERVGVMYAGRIIETGAVDAVFSRPAHPYTLGLLASLPRLEAGQIGLNPLPGEPPDPQKLPSGCPFHPRCVMAEDICADVLPVVEQLPHKRQSACHFWRDCIEVHQ